MKVLPCDSVMDPMEPIYRAGAGAMAGVVGSIGVYPLDVVRARLTVQAEAARSGGGGKPQYVSSA